TLTSMRKWAIGGAVLVAVVLAAIAVLHSQPVRTRLLAAVLAPLEEAGDGVRVESIDYHPQNPTADLSGATACTSASPSTPFFAAQAIHASLPWKSLFGSFVFQRVDLTAPRVTLIRDAEGRTNWPSNSTKPPDATPTRLSIKGARVSDLAFVWNDEQ